MTVSIRSNIAASLVGRRLNEATKDLQQSSTRLASGLRINKANDDSAGLSISSALKVDNRVYAQAIRNVNDVSSVLSIVEGGLQQLSSIVIRQKELAEQAANGVYSPKQRVALNAEANALVKEYNRITQSLTFNNSRILDGIDDSFRTQLGYGVNGGLQIALGQQLGVLAGNGTYLAGAVGGGASAAEETRVDVTMNVSGGAFFISSADGNDYYVWLNWTDDVSIDPLLGGIGIRVDILKGDDYDTIAAKVANALDATGSFTTSVAGSTITVTDRTTGVVTDASDYDLGWGISTNVQGSSGGPSTGQYAVGNSPRSIVTADFNGDGILDIVTADYSSTSLSILLGNSNGGFNPRYTLPTFGNALDLKLADMNNDGIMDIVVADYSVSKVGIYLGNGNGSFKAEQTFSAGGAMWSLALADFNNDGIMDVVTADNSITGVSVLLGNGNGTLKARTTYYTGGQSFRVTTGDFNGDGIIDILSTNTAGNLGILLGNGNGTFLLATTIPTYASPYSASVADLNGDGIADIVLSGLGSASLSVYLGNGDGTFLARSTYALGSASWSSVIADFNGDGILDLASSDSGGRVNVLLGNGNGTFKARSTFGVGTTPYSLTTGDMNNDGVLDILTANLNDNTVSVLIGNGDSTRRNNWTYAIDITNIISARQTLQTLTTQLTRINKELGAVGAYQSRLATAVNNLAVGRENTAAAASRITDADIAEESAAYVRSQVLQKSSIAVLAQANQGPELALKLLQQVTPAKTFDAKK